MFDTHPPLAERIAILRKLEGLDPNERGPVDADITGVPIELDDARGVDRPTDVAPRACGRGGDGLDARELDDGCDGAPARDAADRIVVTRTGHDSARVVPLRREHHQVLERPGLDQVRVDMERIALDPLRNELILLGSGRGFSRSSSWFRSRCPPA